MLCLTVKNKNPINSSLQKWAEQLTSRKLNHSHSSFLKVEIEITGKMGGNHYFYLCFSEKV